MLGVSVLLAACSAPSYVEGDLADAIAAADPGSTLHVPAGRYEGPIVIDKPLTIVGEPGTLIAGSPGEPAVSIRRTHDVTLRGITIEGGESGIYVLGSLGVVIDDVEVRAAEWHGIFAHDAEIEVTDCLVSGLRAARPQGIEIINSDRRPPSRIAGCRIEGPVFEGIVSHVSHVTFENNEVVGSSPRGIVVTEMSAGRIQGNRVSEAEGAAYFCGDQSVCSVVDNSAEHVAAVDPAYTSGMGHGLVVHFNSVAYVNSLQVEGADGEGVVSMLGSTLSPVPVRLGFGHRGLPLLPLAAVLLVLAVAVAGGRLSRRAAVPGSIGGTAAPGNSEMFASAVAVAAPVEVLVSTRRSRNPIDPDTTLGRKRILGVGIFLALFLAFFGFNRLPKLEAVRQDVDVVTAVTTTSEEGGRCFQGSCVETTPEGGCFQGFCIAASPEGGLLQGWLDFSVTYLWLVTVGMTFAFLVAGLAETFFFPDPVGGFRGRGLRGSLQGLAVGPVMTLCSACIVPVVSSFRQRGASVSSTIAITQGSATLNAPALVMVLAIFTPLLAGARIALSVLGALLIGPVAAWTIGRRSEAKGPVGARPIGASASLDPWGTVARRGFVDWLKSSAGFFFRLTPVVILAGFASGLAIQWLTPGTVSQYLGDHLLGIALAATVGILINVPLMFEIPLVAGLMLVGMGTAPAATLLFTAAAAGPITFWGLAKLIPARGIGAFAAATWVLGVAGGLAVLGLEAI
ncbi:MAG: right-handed parallel beta-helix repeat-containing protein [Acidimicrobiia bacterium]